MIYESISQMDVLEMAFKGVLQRNDTWTLRKRVPKKFQEIAGCKEVWKALSAKTRLRAEQEAQRHWNLLLRSWNERLYLQQHKVGEHSTYLGGREIARSYGFRYLPIDQVVKLPLDELIDRISASFPFGDDKPDITVAAAVLGTQTAPTLPLSNVMELYEYSVRYLKRYRTESEWHRLLSPKKKVLRDFIKFSGDISFSAIDNDLLLDFRSYLLNEVDAGNLTQSTVSVYLSHLASVLKTIQKHRYVASDFGADALTVRKGYLLSRPPFSTPWINDVILPSQHLIAQPKQHRALLLALINTGLRVSEAVNLQEADISLETDIPFLDVNNKIRRLKTPNAIRKIPLAGVSLEAFKEFPKGFTDMRADRYASNTLNRHLTIGKLKPTPRHTLHSFRHSFSDRLLDAGADADMRAALLGHKRSTTSYGYGGNLAHKHDVVRKASL